MATSSSSSLPAGSSRGSPIASSSSRTSPSAPRTSTRFTPRRRDGPRRRRSPRSPATLRQPCSWSARSSGCGWPRSAAATTGIDAAAGELEGAHPIAAWVVLHLGEPEGLEQRRPVHTEASPQPLLEAAPAAHGVARGAPPRLDCPLGRRLLFVGAPQPHPVFQTPPPVAEPVGLPVYGEPARSRPRRAGRLPRVRGR